MQACDVRPKQKHSRMKGNGGHETFTTVRIAKKVRGATAGGQNQRAKMQGGKLFTSLDLNED